MTEQDLITLSRSVQRAAQTLEAALAEEERLIAASAKASATRAEADSTYRDLRNQLIMAAVKLDLVS